ncbi:hypothetical protein A0257_10325 [Hymenobacter psoromatis]|nr:hypothetical protein A0257_10325 [Hymenobacter psoromatis]
MKNSSRSLPPLRGLGWLLGLLLLLAGPHAAQAQYPTTTPNPLGTGTGLNKPTVVRPDTATVRKISKKEKRALAAADSAKRTERLFGLHLTRPEKAGYLALLPGAGQIYNHKYWKLPIVYGMLGTLGVVEVFYQQHYSEYSKAYAITALQPSVLPSVLLNTSDYPNASKETSATNIQTGIIFYRRYRDLFIIVGALGYGLQILDAVVDAHLYGFDVSDNLSLNWQPVLLPVPGQLGLAAGLSLTLRAR